MFKLSSITLIAAALIFINLFVPNTVLCLLVRFATGQSRSASHVTTRFVSSPASVAASLVMAANEMSTIQELDRDCKSRSSLYESYGCALTDLSQSCTNTGTR